MQIWIWVIVLTDYAHNMLSNSGMRMDSKVEVSNDFLTSEVPIVSSGRESDGATNDALEVSPVTPAS